MSKITIDYSEINSAAKKARNVSGYYEDFEEELEKKVSKKLSGLPGYDSKGHIGNAKSYASSKIKELREKKNYFSTLATNIEKLANNVEGHEKSVVSGVKKIATEALELKNQSKWQAFCQWAYGAFCVDLMNWNPITRGIGNGIKKGLDWVQEKGTKIVDWFKHGEGKYYLGIALDVLAVVGAVAGTIGAIVLAVGTGGAAAPLVVAAVASTIGTVMTAVDSGFSIYNKIKALKIESNTGDPGQARYYGNISGVNDTIKKSDMGGETANNVWGAVGTGYDVVHTAAEITAFVAGSYGKAGLSGSIVKNADGKNVSRIYTYDPNKAKSNIKNIIFEKVGMKNTNGKWTFDAKRLFSTKGRKTGSYYASELYAEHIIKNEIGRTEYKILSGFKKVTGFPGKIYKKGTNIETIFSNDANWYDKTSSAIDYAGSTNFNISTPIGDFNDSVFKIIDTVVDIAS